MKKLLYLAICLFGTIACTGDFEEMNEPKTGAPIVSPGPMFTRALVTGSGMSYQVWQTMHQTSSSVWTQHWANIVPSFKGDHYEPTIGEGVWHFYYAREHFAPINLNFQTMELIKKIDNNPIQLACAQIWNAYLFHIIADSYGDIPYSQSLVEIKPVFDPQKDVYVHMLSSLSAAITSIKTNQTAGYETFKQADVLYKGDLNKWIKFANALILRLSLRASNVDPELAKSYISKIQLNEIISSNDESAFLLTETKTSAVTHEVKNAMGFVYGWNEVRISKTMMDFLDGTKFGGTIDPRIYQFAEKTKATGEYKGLANGQSSASLGGEPDYFKTNFCNIGPYFNTQDYQVPLFLLTNSETQFLLAEAQLKGWLTGGSSAQAYYEAGIKASMDQYKFYWDKTIAITPEAVQSYLNADGVTFNSAKAFEQIITQKWITLYTNGQEAWSEMRRTGLPKIQALVDPFPGNTEMPRRRLYPTNERLYNSNNYNAAVTRMGGDTQYTKVWWDGGK